ncbi:hypothetical protein HNQ02_003152 [Flavobacterium sp. 7E]|uniref:hypothetical protein n=1 Tax=unclassified Flavobacterium TaxID=196869 RepID=UPI001570AA12|nr:MULTISPECIES: hypothetical protein [unclassified Flavobacterium]MBE0392207.1 hypothetical protein [Flavobacterium sp. PL002]NRS90215.1 hypothetical protein [Flavobacterium sp. 7E]
MQIEYIQNKGIILGGNELFWNEKRSIIRNHLENKHQEDDRIFTMDAYFEDEEPKIINQKRDVYENFNSVENLFFIIYNENDEFIEFEFHTDIDVQIEKINIKSGQELTEIINKFEKNSHKVFEIEEGNYLIPSLKISLMDDEYMGGNNENTLSYFYVAKDISHLEDEITE